MTATPVSGCRPNISICKLRSVIHKLLLRLLLSCPAIRGRMRQLDLVICRYVYDGELDAQFYMLFDSHKRLMGSGDIYPEVSPSLKL